MNFEKGCGYVFCCIICFIKLLEAHGAGKEGTTVLLVSLQIFKIFATVCFCWQMEARRLQLCLMMPFRPASLSTARVCNVRY